MWAPIALAAALSLAGCAFIRSASVPLPAWHARAERAGTADCLLVALPGIGDDWRDLDAGLRAAWRASRSRCDLVYADAHFTYYREGTIAERVRRDLLQPARARGYATLWLLGVSLGGYGALWTAEHAGDLVDGIVLVAPIIAMPPRAAVVEREIRAAGGLSSWRPASVPAARHRLGDAYSHWSWLSRAVRRPAEHPTLVLAYGEDDRLATSASLLASDLPPSRVYRDAGGHDWSTWRTLLARVFRDEPWGTP